MRSMQNSRVDDEFFDSQKYYFPPGTLERTKGQAQPWLEVTPDRDEQGTPGLQPVPNEEQKFQLRGLNEGLAPYRTTGTGHADELAGQGIQVTAPNYEDLSPARSTREEEPLPQAHAHALPSSDWEALEPSQYSQNYQYYLQTGSTPEFDLQPTLPTHSSSLRWNTQPSTSQHDANNHLLYPDSNTSYAAGYRPGPDSSMSLATSYGKDEPRRSLVGGGAKISRKQWVIWAGAAILLVLVVVAAIVGGIVGSEAAKDRNPTQSSSYPSSSSATGVTSDAGNMSLVSSLKTIRVGSRLAVTGYRYGDDNDYAIRLFYQDPDNQLRFVSKESSSANWTMESTLLNTLDHEPGVNGTIAATTYLVNPPKIILYYADTSSVIRGQMFNFDFENGDIAQKGEASSLDLYPLDVADDSKIGAYFPYIASQDSNNQIRWTKMLGQNYSDLSAPWWVNDTDLAIEGSTGTNIVTLPVSQQYVNAGGLVYRNGDGDLTYKIRDEDEQSTAAWTSSKLAKAIPASSAIGAFVVGRLYDANDLVDTYILYQDDMNVIQMVWQDDSLGWKGPRTFEALDGSIPGTDISCLTAGAVDGEISPEQDMNRCFFQISGGKVKEVRYDGTDWQEVGIIPMF
ncbi:hypothetical protein F4780DRAFT_730896 [Xylariomycetidae sp. FL0641]|nr:hypothetical protein F4780DRAFT_730896 [Xylariomycetidae sp. FL0641]